MSSRRRALSVLCWLAIAVLLVRIAVGGAVEDIAAAPSAAGALAVLIGLALVLVAAIVAVALGVGPDARWARTLSAVAAIVAIAFGLILLLAGHESGLLIAAAGALVAVGVLLPEARATPPTEGPRVGSGSHNITNRARWCLPAPANAIRGLLVLSAARLLNYAPAGRTRDDVVRWSRGTSTLPMDGSLRFGGCHVGWQGVWG